MSARSDGADEVRGASTPPDVSRPLPGGEAPPPPRRVLGVPTHGGRFFFGWYLVAAGSVIQFLIGALVNNAFGGYVAVLSAEYGWSKTALSWGFAISRMESGILGPLQGWLTDRLGPKRIMRIGMVIFAIGFFAFSQLWSLPTFFIFFALISLGSSLAGFMPVTVAVVNWFDRSRSMALGISSVGFAVGGLAASVVILAITDLGWRQTAFASGVIVLAVGLPLTSFMLSRPEDVGLRVDGLTPEQVAERRAADAARQRQSTSTEVDFSARQAMRTRSFWTISLGHSSALFVVSAVMVHLFSHLTESLGYSNGEAAFFIGLMTAFQIVGQLAGGWLGDLINKRVIVVGCMAMHAAGLLLVAHLGSLSAVVGFAVLHGLAWGTRGPLMQGIRADYFGRSSFGSIMGFSSMILMIGQIAGPVIAGFLYDRTGSYESGFTIIALIAASGSVFFMLSTRPAPPAVPGNPLPTAGYEA
ncbi:MAG: MFS transporter [Dehalococcoidia bacterium]|nr:MFS transporter [Dehalococcoidia bacterium]